MIAFVDLILKYWNLNQQFTLSMLIEFQITEKRVNNLPKMNRLKF